MPRIVLPLLMAVVAYCASDPWTKVRALKTGAELRIYKTGAKQPLLAIMDELTDESLHVAVKNEQLSIPRDQIERIDARPPQTGGKMTKETRTATTDDLGSQTRQRGPARGSPGPSSSSSSNVNFGGKPDFETVYRRTTVTAPVRP